MQVIFPKMTPLQEKSTLINFIKELQKTYNNSAELNEKQNEIIDFLYQYTQTEVHDINQKLLNQIIPLSITNHIFFQEDAQCSNLRILLGLPKFAPKILSRSGSTITTTKDDVRTIINDALDRDQNSTLLHEKELTQHLITFSLSKQTLDDEKTFFINIESTLSKDIWYLKGSVWSHLNKSSYEVLAHVNNSASFLFSWKSLKLNFFGFFNFLYEIIFSYNKNKTLFRPEPMPNIPEAALLKPADITVDDVSNEVKQRFELDTDEKIKNYVAAYNAEQAAIYAEHMALHTENLANDAEQAYYEANLFSKYFSFDGASQHAEKLRGIADNAALEVKPSRMLSNNLACKADIKLPAKAVRNANQLNSVDKVFNFSNKIKQPLVQSIPNSTPSMRGEHSIITERNDRGPLNVDFIAGINIKSYNTDTPKNNQVDDPTLTKLKEAIQEARETVMKIKAEIMLLKDNIFALTHLPQLNDNEKESDIIKRKKRILHLHSTQIKTLNDELINKTNQRNVLIEYKSSKLFNQAQQEGINITKGQLILLINHPTPLKLEQYRDQNTSGSATTKSILSNKSTHFLDNATLPQVLAVSACSSAIIRQQI